MSYFSKTPEHSILCAKAFLLKSCPKRQTPLLSLSLNLVLIKLSNQLRCKIEENQQVVLLSQGKKTSGLTQFITLSFRVAKNIVDTQKPEIFCAATYPIHFPRDLGFRFCSFGRKFAEPWAFRKPASCLLHHYHAHGLGLPLDLHSCRQ